MVSERVWTNLSVEISTNKTVDQLISEYRVSVACSLALLVGCIQFIMGLSGLGVVTAFFSDTFSSSYTCGSAVHVLVSQIKDLLGIKRANKYEGPLKIPKVNYSKRPKEVFFICREMFEIKNDNQELHVFHHN